MKKIFVLGLCAMTLLMFQDVEASAAETPKQETADWRKEIR